VNTANEPSSLDRLPPQDLEAEKHVLGSMMQEPEALAKSVEILHEWCFYRSEHQKVYTAIVGLFNDGHPVDSLTVANRLEAMKELDNIGGRFFITELIGGVPSAANVEYYARIVLEKSTMRRLAGIGVEITDGAFNVMETSAEVLERAQQKIFKLCTGKRNGMIKIDKVMNETFQVIENNHQSHNGVTGVTSGFDEIDEFTAGFQPSDLIIVAGRPSMGKTAFALNIARNAAIMANKGVAIFSLEMASYQLAMRLLCAEAKVDAQAVRRGRLGRDKFPLLVRAVGRLAAAPIYFDDTPGLSIMEIRAKARRIGIEKQIGMVIVDYIGLATSGQRVNSRNDELGLISKGLKNLAKELNVPVIALSQLSRAVEQRGGDLRPRLSDLRESGNIEQDADVVMFIYRPEVYTRELNDGQAEIIIGKQRNGPTGTAHLLFYKAYTSFVSLSKRSEPEFAAASSFHEPQSDRDESLPF